MTATTPRTFPYFEATADRVVAAYIATTLTLALLMVGAVVPELTDRTDLAETTYAGEFVYQALWTVSSCAVGVAMFWMPIGAYLYSKNLRNPFWFIAAGFLLLAVPILAMSFIVEVAQPHQFPSLSWTDITELAVGAGSIGAIAAWAGWRVAFRRYDRLDL